MNSRPEPRRVAPGTWLLVAALLGLPPAAGQDLPELVFVRLPAAAEPARAAAEPHDPPTDRYVDGSAIVRRIPGPSQPRLVVLTRDFAAAADPAVTFDGEQILFAGRRQPDDPWQIWSMDRDGANLTQITTGPGDKFSPLQVGGLFHLDDLEPTPRMVFVGTDHGWGDEAGGGANRALYGCDLDGRNVHRLSFHLSSVYDPVVLANGRVIFTSRQAADAAGTPGRFALWAISIDGTDLGPYYGHHQPPTLKLMPTVGTDDRVYFIESDSAAWLGGGDLVYVSQHRPLRSRTVVRAAGLAHSPRPLPDGGLVASFRPGGNGTTYGLYRFDPATGERLATVVSIPGQHCIDAQVLAPQPVVKGRSTVVDHQQKTGVFYCLSACLSDLPELGRLARGSFKAVRVVEGIPGPATAGPEVRPAARRILGVAPVEEDGSFHVEVPAEIPLHFQLLDERGMAVAGHRSWLWVMPREWRGCIGCHADREMAPPNVIARATVKPAVQLTLPPHERRHVDFVHEIAPLVAARCTGCHGAGTEGRYETLLAPAATGEGAPVSPGSARRSPLIRHLETLPAGQQLSAIERTLFIEWVDLGAQYDSRAAAAEQEEVNDGPQQ